MGPVKFVQTKGLIDAGVLAAVTPRVHHHHIVGFGFLGAGLFLVKAQGFERIGLTAVKDT